MSDLFRGYDLTAMVEAVAEKRWGVLLAESDLTEMSKAQRTWDLLPPIAKRNFKEELLPIVTDVLEAIEALTPPSRPLIDRRDMKWLVNEVEITREEVFTLLASGEAGLTDRAVLYLAEQEDD